MTLPRQVGDATATASIAELLPAGAFDHFVCDADVVRFRGLRNRNRDAELNIDLHIKDIHFFIAPAQNKILVVYEEVLTI